MTGSLSSYKYEAIGHGVGVTGQAVRPSRLGPILLLCDGTERVHRDSLSLVVATTLHG